MQKHNKARSWAVAAMAGVSAALLTACGGSTVDNADITGEETVAPLERDGGSSAAPEGEETASEGASDSAGEPASEGEDKGAREVDDVPPAQGEFTEKDTAFLDALRTEGVKVEGVENQIIGAGAATCKDDDSDFSEAMLKAVAGQLVEQGRTDKGFKAVHKLLSDAADDAYCS